MAIVAQQRHTHVAGQRGVVDFAGERERRLPGAVGNSHGRD